MHYRVLSTPYFTKAIQNKKASDFVRKEHTPMLAFIHFNVKN